MDVSKVVTWKPRNSWWLEVEELFIYIVSSVYLKHLKAPFTSGELRSYLGFQNPIGLYPGHQLGTGFFKSNNLAIAPNE